MFGFFFFKKKKKQLSWVFWFWVADFGFWIVVRFFCWDFVGICLCFPEKCSFLQHTVVLFLKQDGS